MTDIAQLLAREFGRDLTHVQNVIRLIDEGNTIPFIARYRKEQHGTMDDTTLRDLFDRLQYLRNLQTRRDEIKKSIEAQGKLTEELSTAIDSAQTLTEVEDLYLPYRPKRRTRATIAREKGLEPLAALLLGQAGDLADPSLLARNYLNPEKEVNTSEDALQGASDIIAEQIAEHAALRKALRELFWKEGVLRSAAAKEADSTYRLYYQFARALSQLQGYQVLAINRGERESFLKVSIELPSERALAVIEQHVIKGVCSATPLLRAACADGYTRLLFPSLERELRNDLTDQANEGAIHTFALNLKPLLLQPPVKGKVTMGFDPAYRTGCKLAVVDGTGKVLTTAVIYPTPPHNRVEEARATMKRLIETYQIAHIAIGNGTASRESERFVADLIAELNGNVSYLIVSEAGASVYSASKLGAQEFPNYDVSLRSAVSIARRLQDPLAELVKIDPKAIGVGQYQHDMPSARLDQALCGVVEDCVNAVGADLNTASPSLLCQVSGLTATTAQNIVTYREQQGAFSARKQLLKVPKLGPKAFEQCVGFLRIPESADVLERTGVHPESYEAAKKLLSFCGYSPQDAAQGKLVDLSRRIQEQGTQELATQCGVGVPTLLDLAKELQKPGRDPRDELPAPILRTDVMELSDLSPGMTLLGTVRNVADFGAFVDIGVHQDGLVHLSQLCDRFIRHPSEAVQVGDVVKVRVLEVDAAKKRISLSIKQAK